MWLELSGGGAAGRTSSGPRGHGRTPAVLWKVGAVESLSTGQCDMKASFSASALMTSGRFTLCPGAVLCKVGCLQHSWPLPARCIVTT